MKKFLIMMVIIMGVFAFSGCNIIADILNEAAEEITDSGDDSEYSSTEDDTRTDDSATDDTSSSELTQTFDLYGYTVSTPSGWEDQTESSSDGIWLGMGNEVYADIYLYEGYTLEEEKEYVDTMLPDATILSEESLTINGRPAYQYYYTETTSSVTGELTDYEGYFTIIEVDEGVMDSYFYYPTSNGAPSDSELQLLQDIINSIQ
jgi:hypothetical protein